MRRRYQVEAAFVVGGTSKRDRELRIAGGAREVEPCRHQALVDVEIAQIVHDLKSPLSAIVLEAALLDEKLARGDNAGGQQSLVRINRNAAFLDRLVLDLLDVCSLAAGNLHLVRSPIDLRGLIDHVIDCLIAPIDRRRICVEAARSVTLNVDVFRIERVVANLLDNAISYSPAGSMIVVRVVRNRGGACVSVIDAGPALAAEELAYVFDRYRRATTGRSGHGIGLYVSKKLVEAHGGQIGVETVPGVGSRFFFKLPAS